MFHDLFFQTSSLTKYWQKFQQVDRRKKRNLLIGSSIVTGVAVSCYGIYKYFYSNRNEHKSSSDDDEQNHEIVILDNSCDEDENNGGGELSSVGEAIEFINEIKLELSSVVNSMILDENDSTNARVIVCVIYTFSIANILSRVSSSDLEIIKEIRNIFSEEVTSEIFDFFMYVYIEFWNLMMKFSGANSIKDQNNVSTTDYRIFFNRDFPQDVGLLREEFENDFPFYSVLSKVAFSVSPKQLEELWHQYSNAIFSQFLSNTKYSTSPILIPSELKRELNSNMFITRKLSEYETLLDDLPYFSELDLQLDI
ncbi:predicted protein [Naegleria gruberi]|uniref:Predicted protein n=1 Tax=Naegleria gruberi TaxID=5762 RepID=D2VJZ5_NAEGR|nr:uncharacterized protein NAEGRDRAFT_69215 [Naegleria gruberi]EFC42857.1 predicted protein [Naegleria gruberi]|eukprot:XP_002675601.1 predicted protein [Naegleria gruberi strain NEG-M]